ncbi:MAG TPA: DUF2889 domain-containing protein [Blastocatellia bacterium]|nr:DUF2889 domain-containing protein [Blastocatellia bacterium]
MPAFTRRINIEMEWVDESSFEIHGTLDDDIHSLDARLLVGFPDFVIRSSAAQITRMPYPGLCTGAMGVVAKLDGERIGRGFRKRVGEVLGGASSCNHLHTLINDMAGCAFQMNYVAVKSRPEAAAAMMTVSDDHRLKRQLVLGWMPQLRNSCYVFSEASDAAFEKLLPASVPASAPTEDG